jgi:UDP-N-acetylmuramoylalanine--D-glutamate ligase
MIQTTHFQLQGRHNLLNAMAAVSVARLLKVSKDSIRESLMSFKGVPHRLEQFLRIQNVNYINDSKATNVNATFYALDSVKSQTVWIAGGIDKGNDYSALLPLVREKVKAIVCLGIDNKKLLAVFGPVVDIIVETQSIDEAVKIAHKIADKKETVLLSPACASFDLFENYEDRGNQFKQAVQKL